MKNSSELRIGSILSYVQMVAGIVIGVLYTPIMIRLLGQSEYGLYNTVSSTISMLSILNMGFNAGYIKYYAQYKKNQDDNSIYRLNGLFILIFAIIGVIALVCGLFLSNNLSLVFDQGLTIQEYDTAYVLMVLLSFNLAISFPMSVFQNIITAHEKFVFLKLLGIVRTVLSPLVTLPILLIGYKSVAIVIVSICINTIIDVVYAIYVFVKLKQKFIVKNIDKKIIGGLFAFTGFIAINLIIDQINWNIDKLLLARYKGTASVAVYSVGYSLYTYYMMFSSSISGVFTPRIHTIYNQYIDDVKTRDRELTSLFIKVGRVQFLPLAMIATGLVFYGKPFVIFWAGSEYSEAYYVALLLIIPASIALIQNLGIEIQRAENKHKFRSLAYLIMALANLVISIYLCQLYGPIGSAIGTAVSLILANGLIMNVYYYKRCGINIPLFWKNILKMSRGLIIPIVVGIVYTTFVEINNIWQMICGIVIYAIAYGISMWIFAMNNFEKDIFVKPLKKLFRIGMG